MIIEGGGETNERLTGNGCRVGKVRRRDKPGLEMYKKMQFGANGISFG
jgi:hypothetical protein